MSDIPTYEVLPGTPTHRARPSVITNASGFAESMMSYGSIMSADGLARLSQFPPPPNALPMSFNEQSLSPVSDDASMSPSASPRRALPLPPLPPLPNIAPLNFQKRTTAQAGQPNPPVQRPTIDPEVGPSSHPPSALHYRSPSSSYPSPYDWHEGSSTISADPYGEATLPTHFITSLISSVTEQDGASTKLPSPSQYKRGLYEPSVVSNAMTMDSTVTYPPPQTFRPPVPPLPAPNYPPSPAPPSYRQFQSSMLIGGNDSFMTQEPQHPITGSLSPMGGRGDPEVQTYTSIDQVSAASGLETISSQAGAATTISASPSFQSLNSTTPLMRSFPRGDTIEEEDEPPKSSNGSTPAKSSRDSRPRRSSATYSTKTTKSYMSSLVARISHSTPDRRSLKQLSGDLFRRRPLPPVPPLPHISIRDIRRAEDELPLPDLVSRARVLSRLLDEGHRPHDSLQSLGVPKEAHGVPLENGEEVIYSGTNPNLRQARGRKGRSDEAEEPDTPNKRGTFGFLTLRGRRRLWICIVISILVVGIVVGVAVGVTVSKKSKRPKCPGNLTGASCTLDATCVCVSNNAGSCNQLAQYLVDLVPEMNALFAANFTSGSLATAVWEAQGMPSGPNCAAQANLIDVAPALNPNTAQNRTLWAQSALLWNVALTMDLNAATQLQNFVRDAPWSSLSSADGPVSDSTGTFSIQSSGFRFDFAAQTVTEPPATFLNVGQPSQAQIGAVNNVTEAALNRMYTFAQASSTQQQNALAHFWTATLQQKASDLDTFVSLVRGSAVLLPFDSTLSFDNQLLSNLLTNSSTTPFPPPLACYPGLELSQLELLNSVETTIFGLSPASVTSSFDTSCYPNRPIYGVLDILHLRLPFLDSTTGVAKQAAVLSTDAASRVVVYNGEVLSTLPGASSSNTAVADPRQYGTLNNINHVLLRYLSSIPDVNDAIQLVEFVLTSSAIPPSNTSTLFAAIPSFPALEVAVFGSVMPSDIQYTVSSLSDPHGSLYFGTTASNNLRDWAISAVEQDVVWAELSTSAEVVRDGSYTDIGFNAVWDTAYTYFHSLNNATVGVSNITAALALQGLLTP